MRAFGLVVLTLLAATDAAVRVTERDGLPVVYDYKTGDECPAPQFYLDCNICNCANDGYIASCTKMFCPKVGYQQGDECPAKHFLDDCNVCHCGEDGYSAACTRIHCPFSEELLLKASLNSDHGVVYAPNYSAGDKCPGQFFHNGCNICVCNDDSVSATCPQKSCIPSIPK